MRPADQGGPVLALLFLSSPEFFQGVIDGRDDKDPEQHLSHKWRHGMASFLKNAANNVLRSIHNSTRFMMTKTVLRSCTPIW